MNCATQALLCGLLLVAGVKADIIYNITGLGSLGGNQGRPWGINSSGQVSGASETVANQSGSTHPFIYSNGTMTNIGFAGYGYGINNLGQVTGGGANGAWVYNSSNSILTTLGVLPGWGGSEGHGINNNGEVTGENSSPVGSSALGPFGVSPRHAFTDSGGVMTDIGTLGGTESEGWGINDSGQVVGWASTAGDAAQHAFLYSSGVMSDLGTLGGTTSFAQAINNSGEVAGYSTPAGSIDFHAFIDFAGVMKDLGTLGDFDSYAFGMNDWGDVVGFVDDDGLVNNEDPTARAFLYNNGTMIDLNSLINPSSGWTLRYAFGINDAGQIVGDGLDPEGNEEPFILTPQIQTVPMLSSIKAGLLALLALLISRLVKSRIFRSRNSAFCNAYGVSIERPILNLMKSK